MRLIPLKIIRIKKKEEQKTDSFGCPCKIGDKIVFNSPYYKGLLKATLIGFTKAGRAKINNPLKQNWAIDSQIKEKGFYTITTEFSVTQQLNNEIN